MKEERHHETEVSILDDDCRGPQRRADAGKQRKGDEHRQQELHRELGGAITKLFADAKMRTQVGQAAKRAFEREQGSLLRTLAIVEKTLGETGRSP